jgi:uncharacterized protein (DUF983 family)
MPWCSIFPAGPDAMPPIIWQPDRAVQDRSAPPLATAIGRGLFGRCPACGERHLFNGFLKIMPACRSCGALLGAARADDAPPYFVILLTGHIVIPLILLMQRMQNSPDRLVAAIFLPLTVFLALGLLRPVKGATVGIRMAMGMVKSAE